MKVSMILKQAAASMAAVMLLVSCGDSNKWTVAGKIDGASDKTVMLEKVNNGNWQVLDSAVVAQDGSFKISSPKASFPDIYRLTVDGRSLYFPVDSTETVTVEATLDNLDREYRLSGSTSADLMQRVNDIVMEAVNLRGEQSLATDSVTKRRVAEVLQEDWSGIVAYFAINKSVGQTPLFDPAQSFDRKIIGAVANAYATNKPSDPRTEMLKNAAINQRRDYVTATNPNRVYAAEVPFMEIELLDAAGTPRSLTAEWQKGKVILLNFTVYGTPESAAFNSHLYEIYNKYKNRGLEIYQVSSDADEYQWREAAKNLPWVAVYNAPHNAAETLLKYNVQMLPTTFVIDRDGEHLERILDPADIDKTVAKYLL